MYRNLAFLLTIILATVTVGCGGSTKVQSPATVPAGSVPATAEGAAAVPTNAPPASQAYKVGDPIPLEGGAVFTVQEVKETSDGKLALICLYDNTAGTKDQTVSSMLGFEVKDGDGNKAKFGFSTDDSVPSGLDGTVIKGDKLRGSLTYDASGMGAGKKLYYKADLIGGTIILVDLGQ